MQPANAYDTHGDLLICRYKQGIQLVKPNNRLTHTPQQSLSVVYQKPLSIYFFDNTHAVVDGNDIAARIIGQQFAKEIRGITVERYCHKALEIKIKKNNDEIKCSGNTNIIEEAGLRRDEILLKALSFKFPWYYQDKIIGVFGCSIQIDSASLPNLGAAFSALLSTGLLNTAQIPLKTYHGINFTHRENAVLEQLIRGKTAKQIGEYLHLSSRTVENYIENMKLKTHCKSKPELIEKFIDEFMK